MASLLDRLFGVRSTQPVQAKAAVGAGVYALTWDTPVESLSRNPQKLARQAQALYHSNAYVRGAEGAIVLRAAAVGWHLEDDAGDTIDQHPYLDLAPDPKQFGPIRMVAWRKLTRLTLRHMGLCGYAFWYLDQREALAGTPSSILYINPARMVPAMDRAGNLTGWIMDPDRPGGRPAVPFGPDEILPFIFDPDDDGHLGIGIVESAVAQVRLSEKAAWHAIKTTAAGGRKPGIIMPSTEKGSFSEDEYQAVVKELRNVTDSPDAAKKSLIFKARVDYTDAGTTAEELQLTELMKLSREDIYGLWGVPLSQQGYAGGVGLNSGELRKYDEAELWQGPIKARLDPYSETLQGGLIDRYAALGQPATLELHVPTFDDKEPAYKLAQTAENQPLTDNERRALLGLPPLPDLDGAGAPLGTVIRLPSTVVQVAVVPVESDTSGNVEEGGEIKAKADPIKPLLGLRARTEETWVPRVRTIVSQLLDEQRTEIAARVAQHHGHLVSKPSDTSVWWNEAKWEQRWREALSAAESELGGEVAHGAASIAKRPGKAGFIDSVLSALARTAGARIAGINQTTRDAIKALIGSSISSGQSLDALVRDIRGATAFDDARAETIARTETAYAYNGAAQGAYRELGVQEVDVIDGDKDEICAVANGSRWTLDEAERDPIGHPNCTRDFVPVIGKASLPSGEAKEVDDVDEQTLRRVLAELLTPALAGKATTYAPPIIQVSAPVPDIHVNLPEPNITIQPATVTAPNVTVQPAEVTVNPTFSLPPQPVAKASAPQQVEVVKMPARIHRAARDTTGRIDGSVETDAE